MAAHHEPVQPEEPEVVMLRTHCQTSGWSLTEQDPYNNVVRTDRGHGRGLRRHPVAAHQRARRGHRAADRIPARIARNTQLIIQEETHITNVVDPWAGSYMMEKLTQDMVDKAWGIIQEIEAMGGMTKAVESGWAKMQVETCAADKQARIDSGKDVIVGVNKYKLAKEDPIDILDIDNHAGARGQVARLQKIRATRDSAAVAGCARCADRSAPRPAKATCSTSASRPSACAPRSAKCRTRWRRSSVASAPTTRPFRVFTEASWPDRKAGKRSRRMSRSLPPKRAVVRAS